MNNKGTKRRRGGLATDSEVESRTRAERRRRTGAARFGGQPPYKDLPEVAAAYLYYLCRNHPFVDGNKRAALGACLVFLRLNGFEPAPDSPEWEALTLDVAASYIDRDQTTKRLRKLLL